MILQSAGLDTGTMQTRNPATIMKEEGIERDQSGPLEIDRNDIVPTLYITGLRQCNEKGPRL